MSYARVLKSLRKKNKMTQVVVAKAVDITSAYLSKIENGARIPSMVLLKKIASVYKMPLSIINYMAAKDEISKIKKPKEYQAIQELIDEMIQYLFFEDSFNLKKFSTDFKTVRKLKVRAKQVKTNKLKEYDNVFSKAAKASEGKAKYSKRSSRASKK